MTGNTFITITEKMIFVNKELHIINVPKSFQVFNSKSLTSEIQMRVLNKKTRKCMNRSVNTYNIKKNSPKIPI